MSALAADRAEIGRFVGALFRHADQGGFVSLRTFSHRRDDKPIEIRAVEINGQGLGAVVAQAAGAATRAARHEQPTVFAPPVATFRSKSRAAEADLLNALAVAVECDEHPAAAARTLQALLGGATLIVESGGLWADPETGELQPKLHVYARLKEPTRSPDEHARLKRANRLAAALVGSDPSAVPSVHPLRWAGSVHRKGAAKLCRIAELNDEFEIDLADAEERLEQAARLALEHATSPAADRLRMALELPGRRSSAATSEIDPSAADPDLDALADAIPNDDEPRAEWIAVGLAFFAASEGSDAGHNAWAVWSNKSEKGHGGTVAQWEHFAKSPPDRTGIGALVTRAQRADPEFRLPSWGPKRARAEEPKRAPQAPHHLDEDDRPVVDLQLGELATAVAKSNRHLADRSDAMFVLGDLLMTIERVGGGLQTIRATPARIGLELSRVARFRKIAVTEAGPEFRQCDPPMKLAVAIAEEPGGWRAPILNGLCEVPILRSNGEVVTKLGYDPTSRLYLHGGPFAPVPQDPHQALQLLLDAVSEFPFVEPHHRSAALALLLTSVSRRALRTAPLFGISAREAGTGKGSLAQLAAILANGRGADETPWPAVEEEQRKKITATLLSGCPVFLLDNITETLDGAPLCVLMTSERWSDRMLGQSRQITLPAGVLTIATGNNLRVGGDMCRRTLPIEMDAKVENPELRRFGRNLIPWALRERPRLVAAAVGIIAAHRRAREPLPADFAPLGSFEAWSKTVCGALMWLGQPDPRLGMQALRNADPKRGLLHRMLDGMEKRFGTAWQTVGAIIDASKLGNDDDSLHTAVEEITARARDDKGAKIVLGRWLESQQGRVVGGRRLDAERDTHRKVNTWRSSDANAPEPGP